MTPNRCQDINEIQQTSENVLKTSVVSHADVGTTFAAVGLQKGIWEIPFFYRLLKEFLCIVNTPSWKANFHVNLLPSASKV